MDSSLQGTSTWNKVDVQAETLDARCKEESVLSINSDDGTRFTGVGEDSVGSFSLNGNWFTTGPNSVSPFLLLLTQQISNFNNLIYHIRMKNEAY